MSTITLYTWIGFAIFLVVMFVLGFVSARKTRSVSDFATGGGGLGPYVLGLSFAATYLSAATFLGYPGWTHDWGIVHPLAVSGNDWRWADRGDDGRQKGEETEYEAKVTLPSGLAR